MTVLPDRHRVRLAGDRERTSMAAVAAARGGPRRISAGQVWHGLLAVLVIAALVTQVVLTSQPSEVPLATRDIRLASYFTIQSNILSAISSASVLCRACSERVIASRSAVVDEPAVAGANVKPASRASPAATR